MYLAKLTTAQAKTVLQNDPIVVIPVGSTEQHGPQCALGTDFMIPATWRTGLPISTTCWWCPPSPMASAPIT